jgi:protein-disulfide isomerase
MSEAKIEIAIDDHVKGNAGMPVTLIQYADYRCPYSGAAYPVLQETLSQFEGKVRFVYRHFPLIHLHPAAFPLSVFAEAAGKQGLFWHAHDLLFGAQRSITDERLMQFIGELGIKVDQFNSDLESENIKQKIVKDISRGKALGVQKTPSFLINGKLYQDEWHGSGLRNEIASALEEPWYGSQGQRFEEL